MHQQYWLYIKMLYIYINKTKERNGNKNNNRPMLSIDYI